MKIKKVIKAILIILWSIIVLSITNSFEGFIFPFILLIFGSLFIINIGVLKKIKNKKMNDGYTSKEFKILRIILIIINIFIIGFYSFVLYKTSDIDKNEFKKYMNKNVCIVKKDTNILKNSKKYVIDSYVTDNKKCDFFVGYVSFEEGNNIIFNELIDSYKAGYNLKQDSIYQAGEGTKEITMSGVFFDKKYNFIIHMKSNTIIYALYKEGYNNKIKKIMIDLSYTEKYKFKSLFIR